MRRLHYSGSGPSIADYERITMNAEGEPAYLANMNRNQRQGLCIFNGEVGARHAGCVRVVAQP